jgi:predicted CoA-binding protein
VAVVDPEEGSNLHANPDRREIRDLLQRSGTVAVVGLSDRPYRTSHAIAGALQGFGFKIFPALRVGPGRPYAGGHSRRVPS